MKTCLVSGGAGFIGSHLCDRLIAEGYGVTCVDNLITGTKENIKQLEGRDDFKFIEADVTQTKDYKCDFIFHLASPASPNPNSPRSYMALPVETMLVNSMGTKLLLDVAKSNQARFLLASTSEVYGNPEEHPQPETYWGHVNPNGPRSCYDESKRFGEAITQAYHRNLGVDTRIARIFNTYGPRMDPEDGRVVIDFVIQAFRAKPFVIHGDGQQTRSFCYVTDMVGGLMKLMFTNEASGQVVNLGNPEEYTINQLMKLIAKKIGVSPKRKRLPLPEDDPKRRQPDISLARTLLGWEPKVSLDAGLDKTIEFFREVVR